MRKLLLVAVLGAALCPAPMVAGANGFHECGMVGTWFGAGDTGFTWMGVNTTGSINTLGQSRFQWVVFDPTLFGYFPTAIRATDATGVWQQARHNTYNYTWVAYGLDGNGAVVYTARASGTQVRADCDHMNVTYVLEIWVGSPEPDMSTDAPDFCFPGAAAVTRMPPVQATCP